MGTTLATLKPPPGARRRRKRVGRGPGSGNGKTCGRGHKGQRSRSGASLVRGFEGGQMPLQRRVPKRGFTNIYRERVDSVNVDVLEQVFEPGVVNPDDMRSRGVVPRKARIIKVLGRGEVKKAFTVQAHRFSGTAKEKIEAAGGTVEIIETTRPAATATASASVKPPPIPEDAE
ncbi:50S ribosomal protein L15 [Myxococcota bacterium]